MNVFILILYLTTANGVVEQPVAAYRTMRQCEQVGRAAAAHVNRQLPVARGVAPRTTFQCIRGYDL